MDSVFDNLTTSHRLKAIMAIRAITQSEIAKLLDCTDETIRNRLRADTWDINDLKKIVARYGIDLNDLI